jgi:hypothetical protein
MAGACACACACVQAWVFDNVWFTVNFETPRFTALNFGTATVEIYGTKFWHGNRRNLRHYISERQQSFTALHFGTTTVEIYGTKFRNDNRRNLRNAGPARLAHMQNGMITPPTAKPSVVWTAAPPKQKLLQHTVPPHPACKRKLTFDDCVE